MQCIKSKLSIGNSIYLEQDRSIEAIEEKAGKLKENLLLSLLTKGISSQNYILRVRL